MYTDRNFKTKKALKEALANGEVITFHQPGPWPTPTNGTVFLEGPHYPEAHKWYAAALAKDGRIIKIS